jgi:hypothetical protein
VTRRGLKRESGASLVEMAIVIPLFLILVMGIIEFGFLFYRNISINQGVRDAARSAVVGNYACGAGTATQEISCLADKRSGLATTTSYVHLESGVDIGDEITVCSDYAESAITGLMQPFLPGHLKSKVTMRLEKALPAGTTDGGDAAFPNVVNCHA